MSVPYVEHAAVVHGHAAVAVGYLLERHLASEDGKAELSAMPPAVRAATLAALDAVKLAATAHVRRHQPPTIAGNGNPAGERATTATPAAPVRAHSDGDGRVLGVDDVMAAFGVKRRQARNIAAGMGAKVAGRWIVDADVVAAELVRRGIAS